MDRFEELWALTHEVWERGFLGATVHAAARTEKQPGLRRLQFIHEVRCIKAEIDVITAIYGIIK